MQSSQNRRVVITGIGVVTPLGNDPDQLIAALHEGQSGIKPLSRVPHDALSVNHGAEAWQFSGDIADYGPLDKQLKRAIKKGSKVMCREIEMGVAAAQLALNDSGLTEENRDPLRTGVVYGCDYIMSLPQEFIAGIAKCLDDEGQFDFSKWGQEGKPEVSPLWLLKYLPNMPASHIAIYNDLRGPNNSITLRESSAGAAMSEAFSTISRGHADVLVVGSTGSRIHLLRSVHTQLQESLAAERDEPETMSRPFNETRDGSVLGEGAGARRSWQSLFWPASSARGIFSFAIQHDKEGQLEAGAPRGAHPISAVDHVVVQTKDALAAKRFYRDQVGLRLAIEREAPDWGGSFLFFRGGALTVEVIASAKSPETDRLWGIALETQDLEGTCARLREDGVIVSEIREGRKPGTWVATVKSHCLEVPTLLIQPPPLGAASPAV